MKQRLLTLLTAFVLTGTLGVLPVAPAWGQRVADENTKQAQTGMKWLGASLDPRAAAMGSSATTFKMGAASMFYNTAGMAYMEHFGHFAGATMQWIAGINYTQGALALRPADGKYGVFGLTFRTVDYGGLEGTIRADNQQGYIETGTFSPSALAVGVGYAIALTDRVSIGGNVKYALQDLGSSIMRVKDNGGYVTQSNQESTPVFDFGILYDTGFNGLMFGMSARNFSPAVRYEEEGFETPLALSVGVSADVMNFLNLSPAMARRHQLLLSVDAMTPRDFSEHFRIGGEYTFMNMLSLRAGYAYPTPADASGLSLGGGIQVGIGNLELGADYAYTRFDIFGAVHRVGIDVAF